MFHFIDHIFCTFTQIQNRNFPVILINKITDNSIRNKSIQPALKGVQLTPRRNKSNTYNLIK